MDLFNLVRLGGGLSLFIFGIHLLSKGLEKYAGAKLQSLIERLTNRPIKGFFVGILTTASLQSSSLTMVTIIGLINAGIMTFNQAIGVILGSEIGTTLTVQIIAFNIGDFYFLPLIAGIVIFFTSRKFKYKYLGQAIIGFGLLFMGMSIMSASMVPLADEPAFTELLAYMGVNIPLAIVMGLVLTAIIQSSAAMIGAVIAMSMSGIIGLPAAIGVVLGANIGTCITSVIASWNSSISAKRAAVAQIFISVIGVLAFSPFVYQYASFIQLTSEAMPRQIANAHTIFNLVVALALLPLSKQMVSLAERIVPGKDVAQEDIMSMRKEEIMKSPDLALKYAEKELEKVLGMTVGMLKDSKVALLQSDKKAVKSVWENEPKVDRLRYVIEDFLDKVSWLDATEEQLKQKMRVFHNTTDMERVGDHAENIANYADERIKRKVNFSGDAVSDLNFMFNKVIDAYTFAVESIIKKNPVLASKTVMVEETVDDLYWQYRDKHIERLEKGICKPQSEEIFSNVMRDLERISDHADNLAKSIIHQLGDTEI